MRTRELVESGAQSLFPESFYLSILTDSPAIVFPNERSHTEGEYEKLRENAERWHLKRTEFMLSRLRKGKHPDTHSDFWTGYAEVAPYQITYRPLSLDERLHRGERGAQIIVFSLIGGIFVAGAVGGVVLVRGVRRHFKSRST